MPLRSYAQRYRRELLESVIPFWMRHSLDAEFGGFFTCLDRQGRVYDDRKYVWLQGRQVWTLSRLYRTVEPRAEWIETARRGLDFLRRNALDSQGRVYFSLTRDGRPAGYQRKPYAAVFLTLALAEFARASGETALLDEAAALYRRIQTWIDQPSLLGRPALEGQRPLRQLADLMVVASLCLELHEARPDARHLETMRSIIAKALEHYEPQRRVFLENVAPDGTPVLDLPDGRMVCPGNALETAWFLLHLLEVCPNDAQLRRVLAAIEGALEFGWDTRDGGLFYFMDLEGRPTLQLESSMKLWWPHTEALYALVLAYLGTGESRWLKWLERVDEYTFRTFSDPQYGEWFGYCDRRGEVVLDAKGGNYKGCFHIPRFLMLATERIEAATAAC